MKSISISRSKTFHNCPLQYKYTYVNRFEPEEEVHIDVTDKGLVLHQTFENLLKYENYVNEEASMPHSVADSKTVLAFFKEAMEENKLSEEVAKEFKLKRGLKRWLSFKHDYLDKNGHVMYAEKRYDQVLFGETKTTAILDLLEDCGNGNFIIYDYKTPKTANPSQYKEQLALYAYMMAVTKGIIAPESNEYEKVKEHFKLFVFFPLVDNESETYEACLKEVKFTAKDVENTVEGLKNTVAEIEAFNWEKPAEALQPAVMSFKCNWCKFRGSKPDPSIGFEGCPISCFCQPTDLKFKKA